MKPFFVLMGKDQPSPALRGYLQKKIPQCRLYEFEFCLVFASRGEDFTFGQRQFILDEDRGPNVQRLVREHPAGAHAFVHISKNALLACNDAFAREPLYYVQSPGDDQTFVQAISNLPEAFALVHKRQISDDEADHFVEHATLSAPDRTLFENEKALTGAAVLEVTSTGRISLHPKAALPLVEVPSKFHERAEMLRYLIDKSCRSLSGAAVALSGGLDASTVYASLSLQQLSPIAATLARRWGDEEGAFTRKVSDHFSSPLLRVFKEDEDIFSNVLLARDNCYYPREDFVSSRGRLFEQMRKAGATCVVTGHGADPLFQHGPRAVRESFMRRPAQTARAYFKTWALHRHRAPTGALAAYRETKTQRPTHPAQRTQPVATLSRAAWRHTFSMMARQAHESGLRLTLPFLEPEVVSFALALPVLPDCGAKAILRAAAQKRLPQEILERPKTPLSYEPKLSLNLQGIRAHVDDFHHPRASGYIKKERFKAFDVTEVQSIEKLNYGDLEKLYPALSFATWLRENEDWMTRHGRAC